MKNKKLLSFLVCLSGSICVLSGCGNSNNNPGTDGDLKPITINSLYEGMVALYQTKNYTLEIIHTSGSYRYETPDMIFTKNYIGYDGTVYENLDVYYNDTKGIYRVSFSDDFQAGQYLTNKSGSNYTNLWDNSVVYTMYGTSGAYIKENVKEDTKEITITDKNYKIRFMQTIVGTLSDYANINDLTAKYENNKVIFNLGLYNNTVNYIVTLKNVGNTKSSHLNMFIDNNGKPYEPCKEFSEMKRLIGKDNFVQRTSAVKDGEVYYAGWQFFTEHYFFIANSSDSSTGYAYMEFDYQDDPELDNDFDMWGIYLVYVDREEDGNIVASLSSNRAYNSATVEIEECCFYPSTRLEILQNLEYIKEGEVRDCNYQMTAEEAKRYYFIDQKLVNNFIHNFSLDSGGFEDVIYGTIALEIKLAEEDKDCVICFHAIGYYPGDGLTYDILIPLTGFGDANRVALDYIYNQYNVKTN